MRTVLIVLLVLVLLLVGAAFVVASKLDGAVKAAVENVGPQATGTSVKLDSVKISIFSGEGALRGFKVGNPEGYKTEHAVSLDKGQMKLELGSVTTDVLVIERLELDGAEVIYEKGPGGDNLKVIQQNIDKFTGPSESTRKVVIKEFWLKNSKAKLSAALLAGKAVPIPIPDIHLKDIGTKEQAVTVREAIDQITAPIYKALNTLPLDSGIIENIKEKAGDAVDKIKGIFKK